MTPTNTARPEPTMDATTLEKTVRLLAARLEAHHDQLNRINVYPVPDADTGDNLAAMIDAVIGRLPSGPVRAEVVDAVATGALLGGRGSSGVIFGQALRGFVTGLPDPCGAGEVASALTAAATAARDAVADPVDGTIITVAADAARRATAVAYRGSVLDVVRAAAEEGRRSLAHTPELLYALARAGVVDAGGFGYVLFLDALTEAVTGAAGPPLEASAPARPVDGHSRGGRYEVMCLIATDRARADSLRERWLSIGDTVAIAGDDGTWRCHVHTDDVDAALSAARQAGQLSDVRITDLADRPGGETP
ncbi:MAG: DAK2 domain-containing protein [Mycobacterium sp.]